MSLCAGNKDRNGLLAVRNPLGAGPGDEVEIEVPEASYATELAKIFGFLLIAAFAGMALAYVASPLRGLTPGENGFFGLLAGLLLCGFYIHHRHHHGRESVRWPVIIRILGKGEIHG